MLVRHREDRALIKVLNPDDLFDPFKETIQGRQQAGQEEQPPESYSKEQLLFPSGESLPQCWIDPEYQFH